MPWEREASEASVLLTVVAEDRSPRFQHSAPAHLSVGTVVAGDRYKRSPHSEPVPFAYRAAS